MSIRLIVDIRLKEGTEDDLRTAYAALVGRAATEPGLIGHQLCQSLEDPGHWLVTSEWETLEQSGRWDQSEDHRRLLGPMRACFEQASRSAFEVRDGLDDL
jgi:heme-degrading monooxygenase HmoA